MGDKTGIEWTDATWNPTTGCDRTSPGCDHCYALAQAGRLKLMGSARYQNDGDPRTSGPGFKATTHPEALDQPLRWRRPRRIFVNSMSDLFHPDIPDDFIARVFAVMALADQHTFQVLTKRPQRMEHVIGGAPSQSRVSIRETVRGYAEDMRPGGMTEMMPWPLPNVWLGTSVESQQYAFRARHLLNTPAAVRFISAEPLLGPLDLSEYLRPWRYADPGDLTGPEVRTTPGWPQPRLDWLIVGGESGRSARPMDPQWARDLRDQAQAAGTAYHFKQWGEWGIQGWAVGETDGPTVKMGKRNAGRLLDGRTWDEYPT